MKNPKHSLALFAALTLAACQTPSPRLDVLTWSGVRQGYALRVYTPQHLVAGRLLTAVRNDFSPSIFADGEPWAMTDDLNSVVIVRAKREQLPLVIELLARRDTPPTSASVAPGAGR